MISPTLISKQPCIALHRCSDLLDVPRHYAITNAIDTIA